MPPTEPIRLGSVAYHGYHSLSEAFYDLNEVAQAVYMSIVAKRLDQESPVVMLNVSGAADIFGMTPMDFYKCIATITGSVVISDLHANKVYTSLAVSVQEFFDLETPANPVGLVLVIPVLKEHEDLLEQLDDIVKEIPNG